MAVKSLTRRLKKMILNGGEETIKLLERNGTKTLI